MFRVEPNFALAPERVDALHAVDLRLSFGFHGDIQMPFNPDYTQQLTVLGVTSEDYARAATFADQLQPGRDVLAQEHSGKAGKHDFSELVGRTGKLARNTYGVTPEDTHNLINGAAAVFGSGLETPLAATWEKYRRLHIIDPILHAGGRAAMRGVCVWHADATETQLQEFLNRRFPVFGPPTSERALVRYYMGAESRFRNNRTLEQLGDAALTMNTSGPERPILGYTGGGAHRKDLERKLRAHGIPFRTELFSPDWQKRHK
jgi:hypothetical protein